MTTTMTPNVVELGKGELYTIEAFYVEIEDGEVYEDERCEDVDTYWTESKGDLMEYVRAECEYIDCEDPVMVQVTARRYATLVDGELEEVGESCLGGDTYIWHNNKLMREGEFTM